MSKMISVPHAFKVLNSFNAHMTRQLGVMDGFSKSITTYALENDLQFPKVTLPNFEMRALFFRQQTGALRVDWFPFVTDETRSDWEAYAFERQDWLLAAAERERKYRLAQDERFEFDDAGGIPGVTVYPTVDDDEDAAKKNASATPTLGTSTDAFSPSIYGKPKGEYAVESQGPYIVLWQFSPVTPTKGSLNFNLLTAASGPSFGAVMESKRALLGNTLQLTDPNDPASGTHAAIYAKSLSIGQYRHSLAELAGDPTTNIIYPVFSSFDENRTFVGVVRAALYWRFYFVDILPAHVEGMICVISNTWNQTFTYRIDGPHVTFLGPGDRHDPKYGAFAIEDFITDHLQENQGPTDTAFLQAELDDQFISYTIRLYPSEEMEEGILTSKPMLFSLVALIAFLVPSIVFLVYNHFVEQRQTVVMDRAVATGNIVSSLFPENVANRLMAESNGTGQHRGHGSLMRHLEGMDGASPGDIVKASEPIADRFEACTVMFGDLAGFTGWSTSRSPEQVFILLEHIYCAFDEIAERRKVFKVETVRFNPSICFGRVQLTPLKMKVGDCYVAVTGLPTPQDDHAVLMAKFARDCIVRLPSVIHNIKDELGEETAALQLRIGLHTGCVTAGVLRGQKSRFQLYGDTINTTARMESNGIPGRIHISQAEADALMSRGKESWIRPREDLIEAKGKGKMQTYWLEPPHVSTHTP